jgi:hypothetical protein
MLNYEHEITKPKKTLINKFLWCDYFHDSILKNIRIENGWNDIYLQLLCAREWDEIDNSISYDINNDICDYELHFSGCLHHNSTVIKEKYYIEYLNWRFKNSAKLKKLSKNKKNNFYHFRIQFTHWNLDIIFNKFWIRRLHWELKWFKIKDKLNYFEKILLKYKDVDPKILLEYSKNWEYPYKQESLEYLFLTNYNNLKSLVIDALSDDDACIAAIYILWEIWSIEDIKYLSNTLILLESWSESSKLFFEKQIQDSIEKIIYNHTLWMQDN